MELNHAGDLARQLESVGGYLADPGLAAASFLALRLGKPLLLEGAPGVGKTGLALALATVLGADLERIQCYPGLDASQTLYDWNFPAQMMALRAAGAGDQSSRVPALWSEKYLIKRPVLKALQGPSVLLIDEIDRADDDFEALLLQVLDTHEITIPELGTIKAERPPVVVLTSNRTREVHDAVKRRCLYHWIDHPSPDREAAILTRRIEGLPPEVAVGIASSMAILRQLGLIKPPSLAEAIDFALGLMASGEPIDSTAAVTSAISTVLKHHEDESAVCSVLLPDAT